VVLRLQRERSQQLAQQIVAKFHRQYQSRILYADFADTADGKDKPESGF
jgi:hypothetical protein